MSHHRRISIVALTILATAGIAPPLVEANSLLSGYGGPGQGSQAILGSAVIGGGGSGTAGGGSGSGGGSGGHGGALGGGTRGGPAFSKAAESSHYGEPHGNGSNRGGNREASNVANGGAGRQGASSALGTGTHTLVGGTSSYPTAPAERAYLARAASQTGWLSSGDLAYVLLALLLLALTAVLTRALARTGGLGAHLGLKRSAAGPE